MSIEKRKVYLSDLLSFTTAFLIPNLIDIQQYDLNKFIAILILFNVLIAVFYASNKIYKKILGSKDKVVGFGYFVIACIVIATVGTFM
ncbi:hypothetical protein [Bacillus suaedaesalsae]|uniref:Uncharacterized protein n=1 Tax=Bacillus suaedaesalsae TaxID=2810349 RepID=A0ABS2DHS7_9BACI|nr:hypothetical protein [Bacillus suaedaesalsae]MBM6618003.1 hypothetical protein [Bacillus suaedaesalsae]